MNPDIPRHRRATVASRTIEPVECRPPFACTVPALVGGQGRLGALTIAAGSRLLLIARESLPMNANAEAKLTSVEWAAIHAGFPTARRSTDQMVLVRSARVCHMPCAAFVYKTGSLQHATRNLQSFDCAQDRSAICNGQPTDDRTATDRCTTSRDGAAACAATCRHAATLVSLRLRRHPLPALDAAQR
jgi:hypothetical protein